MVDTNQTKTHQGSYVAPFLTGLMMGGMAGGVIMLLLAPQSGKETRAQFQAKGVELRDQAVGDVDDTLKQVRSSARKIRHDVVEKAEELYEMGEDMVRDQRHNLSTLIEPGN